MEDTVKRGMMSIIKYLIPQDSTRPKRKITNFISDSSDTSSPGSKGKEKGKYNLGTFIDNCILFIIFSVY